MLQGKYTVSPIGDSIISVGTEMTWKRRIKNIIIDVFICEYFFFGVSLSKMVKFMV